MTNQTPESVIAEVIEYHADTIGTHYEGCYKHHAGCLAVRLRDMLREPGEPNDDREALLEADELYDSIGVTLFRAEFRETYTKLSRATVPDAATAELVRIKPLFENLSREYPNECNKRVKAEAERDAATAAIERVRALETFLITDTYPAWTAVDHDDLLAALDGAPEPEVKP